MDLRPTHILLDAARMEEAMERARELNPNHESLYRAPKGEDEILPAVAPFLFSWPHSKEFAEFVTGEGWGNSWGVWIDSPNDFNTLYKHLRRFLTVQTEDGKQLYFRFYDPRVLRIFLPTCDTYQLKDFFGPVRAFLMEEEDPERALVATLPKGNLQQDQQTRAEIAPALEFRDTAAKAKKSWWDWS